MKLLISDENGNVLGIMSELEGFDLDKPMARSAVADAVKYGMRNLKIQVEDGDDDHRPEPDGLAFEL